MSNKAEHVITVCLKIFDFKFQVILGRVLFVVCIMFVDAPYTYMIKINCILSTSP